MSNWEWRVDLREPGAVHYAKPYASSLKLMMEEASGFASRRSTWTEEQANAR